MLIPNTLLALGGQNALEKHLSSLNSNSSCTTNPRTPVYLADYKIGEIHKTDLLRNLHETRLPKFGFEEENMKIFRLDFLNSQELQWGHVSKLVSLRFFLGFSKIELNALLKLNVKQGSCEKQLL